VYSIVERVHKPLFGFRYTGNVIIPRNIETGVFSQTNLLCRIRRMSNLYGQLYNYKADYNRSRIEAVSLRLTVKTILTNY
jgi:hypothetical protein